MLLVILLFNVLIQSVLCYEIMVFIGFIFQIGLNKDNLFVIIFFCIFFAILLISAISHQLKAIYIKNEINEKERLRLKHISADFLLNDVDFIVVSYKKIIIEIVNKHIILISRICLECISDRLLSLIIYIKLKHINNYQYILITALNNCNKFFYLFEIIYNQTFKFLQFLENLLSDIFKFAKLLIYFFYTILTPVIITFKMFKLLLDFNNNFMIRCYQSQIKQYLQVQNTISQQDYLSILAILQNDFKGKLT